MLTFIKYSESYNKNAMKAHLVLAHKRYLILFTNNFVIRKQLFATRLRSNALTSCIILREY